MAGSEDIVQRIQRLKEACNGIIIVHNYQLPEIQDIGDIVGDSLKLAKDASSTEAETIIFCGVNFMAETAKILSPGKVVLHPDPDSRCPMAAMVEPELLRKMKSEHPDAVVVSYVNTTADVKAESDICCTSANAVRIVKSLPERKIIFTPDRNLGLYIQRYVPDKEMLLWPGFCATHHNKVTVEELKKLKDAHPNADVLVHPECRPDVIDFADHVFSTEGMVNHAKTSDKSEFIIGTEREMCYRLRKEMPGKTFHSIETAVCENMKLITLEKVLRSLETMGPEIELPQDIMERARIPLERMVGIGRGD